MFEKYGLYLILAGLLLLIIAWLALVRRAFGEGWGWGLAVLLGIGVPIFMLRRSDRARGPVTVFFIGLLVIGGTYAVNYYVTNHLSFGPRDKMVDGERHLTLTGWNGVASVPLFQSEVELETGYAILKDMNDLVVLQMANPDVTDETLDYLAGMEKLQELDLNDTQITDEALRKLAALPNLRILRIRKTAVTDQGFRDHLYGKESLLEVDARETAIASKTMREWKAQRPDDRKYVR